MMRIWAAITAAMFGLVAGAIAGAVVSMLAIAGWTWLTDRDALRDGQYPVVLVLAGSAGGILGGVIGCALACVMALRSFGRSTRFH